MKRSVLIFLLILFVGAVVALGYFAVRHWLPPQERAAIQILGMHVEQVSAPGANKPAGWLKEFTLTERSGEQVESQDLHGKVQVACFFFARCQASCRKQTETMRAVQEAYEGKDVVFLSITCDPSFDTPEALSKYAAEFEAPKDQWLFLTGDMNYLKRVGGEAFFLPVEERGHVDRFAVRDKWGNFRGAFDWTDPAEIVKLKILVDKLLVETEPPAEFAAGAAAASENSDEEASAEEGATQEISVEEEVAVGAERS
ncbi:MAG TPA: SCO family protein [Pirellulaceae bacterium]|jgi:cytochrome oxidase Cu insertion factor (SCO1/SenC/PrrC family)|nr:SCO family protein [Pirellulaceae bacterium]